jgi:hypothetical protein
MKTLEDIIIFYDSSTRTSDGRMIQLKFEEDSIDPDKISFLNNYFQFSIDTFSNEVFCKNKKVEYFENLTFLRAFSFSNMDNLPFGTFILKISLMGLESKFISPVLLTANTKLVNIGTIKLSPNKEVVLKDVKVVGKSDVLTTGIDKKIYNVAEDLSVKGGTANDILNRLPSVEVDQDGNVMLRGEGTVTVLIDGRQSSLSGGNGKSLLDALPAGSVERIEIVTNPSAKYNPDGTSGIINIVLKKNKLPLQPPNFNN